MKKQTTKFAILALCGSHLICCGIPAALAIFGIFGTTAAGMDLFPDWLEYTLFAFGGLALTASFAMYKSVSIWLIISASALYIFSIAMHFLH
jgi:hypothetical protein